MKKDTGKSKRKERVNKEVQENERKGNKLGRLEKERG